MIKKVEIRPIIWVNLHFYSINMRGMKEKCAP